MKNVPIYELTEPQRLWLETVYDLLKQNKRPQYRKIRTALDNQIPRNFEARQLSPLLSDYNGETISLLGVIALEKNYSVLEKANSIITGIRDMLVEAPETEEIDFAKLAEKMSLSEAEIGLLFPMIAQYGTFYRSAAYRDNDSPGYKSISLDRQETFDAYMKFRDIESLMLMYIDEEARRSVKADQHSQPIVKDISVKGQPIFRSVVTQVNKKLAFVLMPFSEPWSDRLYKLIKEELDAIGLQCLRADNLTGELVMEDIWININQAAFIIADLTGRNPNVMYEMGIVHTIGKPAILITQHINDRPFDLTHLRHYGYQDNVDGFASLRKHLRKAVKGIYNSYYPELPVH